MMEYGQRLRKRPLFSCIHCKRNRTSFVNERYRMTDHVKKHHFPLNQAPFYCSLCLFRCSSREALNKHVTDYEKHAVLAAMQGGGDQSRYLIENTHPKEVQEGVDYELAAHETIYQGQGELVNVKMTPQVFANLFNGPGMSTGTALPYTPTSPEFNRFETSKTVPFEQDLDNFDVFDDFYQSPATVSVGSEFPIYLPAPVISSANVSVSVGSGFTTYLPTPVITSANLGVPQATPAQGGQNDFSQHKVCALAPGFSSRLNTPVMDEPKRVVSKAASTQTEQEATQEPSLVATALFQLEKTIESSIGKLISAVEWNSRAIKNLEVTVQKVGDQRRQKDHEPDKMGAKRLKKSGQFCFGSLVECSYYFASNRVCPVKCSDFKCSNCSSKKSICLVKFLMFRLFFL
ncbi:hypothetical protein DPMN_014732 [Dreissena polymorpha]|uniref:Uncharacterized protein n=1 Tax=Dreissena polymorpha TaxID=45954 RepID=A0A9D4N6J4_DREPO|nr:hypothetical protein DPMN_014732 [Dreissena polymorpha]